MVTKFGNWPDVGVKDVMVGGAPGSFADQVTVKIPELVTVPAGVVTEIGPVVASDLICACISVGDMTLTFAEGMPFIVTCVVPSKFVPVIVTKAGPLPDVGVKDVIVGGAPPSPA